MTTPQDTKAQNSELSSNQVIALFTAIGVIASILYSQRSVELSVKSLEVATQSLELGRQAERRQEERDNSMRRASFAFDALTSAVELKIESQSKYARCQVHSAQSLELPLLINCGAAAREVTICWQLKADAAKDKDGKVKPVSVQKTPTYAMTPFHIRSGEDARLQHWQLPDFLMNDPPKVATVFRGSIVIQWKDLDFKPQQTRQGFSIEWKPCERCGKSGTATLRFHQIEQLDSFRSAFG